VVGGAIALLFLAATFKPVVEQDGVNYYAYLHSIVIDHDLDFSDEYRAAEAAHVSVTDVLVGTRMSTGLLANFQPVGSALLALPFYLVALASHPNGEPQFGPPFITAFVVASVFYGLMALALSVRLAEGVTGSRPAAAGAAVTAALATPFVYYLVYEPSYSHTFSAFAAAAFILAWWRRPRDGSVLGWFVLGLLGGLPALIRFQDGLLVGLALIDVPRARWRALAFLPGVALTFSPQLVVDRVVFGTWLPYRPAAFALEPWPGHYVQVLFASHHGLFIWTPVIAVAAVGTALLRDRRLALAALYSFCAELAINGAAPDWWGGFSFGMRRFLDLLPFVIVGLAEVARRLQPRVAALAAALFTAWNFVLMANFTYWIRTDRDLGYRGLLMGQVEALGYLERLFVQGAVVRNLVFWRRLHLAFEPAEGLTLLALLSACLLAAVWAASARRRAATVRSAS